ncbi:hypothetical protein OBBRIDRAFT_793771 [Obba rivulosa]|uniref:Uncharacterized protein n=1 Tax=Obba rivulosa TaxID=1052685 RepID=A0A8E2AS43_9APHY|nr:hypothetical protein OBBRIDRAFT_793771 [Obba rivulosa]
MLATTRPFTSHSTASSSSTAASMTEVSVKVYDSATGSWLRQTFPAEDILRPPPLKRRFGPVHPEDAGFPFLARQRIPLGARYCEELDAYVPEDLSYRIRGIKKLRLPLKERILTREFWRRGGDCAKANRIVSAIGLTHSSITLVPLKDAQRNPDIKYRCLDDF